MPVLWPRGFPTLPASGRLIALPVASLLLLVAGASTTNAQVSSSPVPSKARITSDSGRVVQEVIKDFPSRLTDAVQKIRQPNRLKKVDREKGHPPYPILFVHGLNGSNLDWAIVTGELSLGRGWSLAPFFDASLNSDPHSTRLEDDVVTLFSNQSNCCGEEASDDNVFLVNFDVAYDPSTGEVTPYEGNGLGRSNSNESAIIKQGHALELAIEQVLEATGEEKVVLVGHSMGGLAIREYLQRQAPDGDPRWWVNPGEFEGHRVARVVTYGTPHLGSNTGVSDFLDWCGLVSIDCDSEAVRDLRWRYASKQKGRYLYGGSEQVLKEAEGDPPNFIYYNYDINADGDESDDIRGINVTGATEPWNGSYSNPDMPLPSLVPYTWITASPRNTGDGVVFQSRQWLWTVADGEKVASPTGADTLLTDHCHTDNLPWCNGPRQLEDVSGFIRGLDEPDVWSTAYRVSTDEPEGTFIDGYFTAPSGTPASFLDWDAYQFSPDQSGSVTLSLLSQTQLSIFLTENGLATAAGQLPQEANSLQVTTSVAAGFTHSAFLRTGVFSAAKLEPYSFRLDTRKLQHFSYEPRHGAFADTTAQGFATVFVPRDVPQINGGALDAGDEIGIFTPDGNAVGAAVWNEAPTFVTAFGDETGGLSEGDSIHVRLWDREADKEYFVSGKLSGNDGRYEPGVVYTAERLEATVLAENAAPVAEADTFRAKEDSLLTVEAPGVLANDMDPNGDTLTADVASGPSHGTLALKNSGAFQYTPSTNFNGTDRFEYIAADPGDLTDTAAVQIRIEPVNDRPLAEATLPDDTLKTPGPPLQLTSLERTVFSDPEGEDLSFSGSSSSPSVIETLGQSSEALLLKPKDPGTADISVTASDGQADTSLSFQAVVKQRGPLEPVPDEQATAIVSPSESGPTAVNFGTTGAEAAFSGVESSGPVTARFYPGGGDSTEARPATATVDSFEHVSPYRWQFESREVSFDSVEVALALSDTSVSGIGTPTSTRVVRDADEDGAYEEILPTRYDNRGTPSDSTDDVLVAHGLTGFSSLFLASNHSANPLPVELAHFEAKAKGRSALLRWTAGSETNSSGFSVQHQPPGAAEWKTLGFVESKAPGGTTSEPTSYQYVAEGLVVGTHRFRLKQIDLDGSSSLSDPRTAELKMKTPLRLGAPVPNPARIRAALSFAVKEKAWATVRLYNTLGQRVATLFEGTPSPGESRRLRVDVSDLPSGVYFVRLKANGRTETQRVTVVH